MFLRLSKFNTSCKTTFIVVSLLCREEGNRSFSLVFCPLGLKKGAEMRKIISEVVKKVTELVKISSVKIRKLSDLRMTIARKKLFCSLTVKSSRRIIVLKMKQF